MTTYEFYEAVNKKYNIGRGLEDEDLQLLCEYCDKIPTGGVYAEIGVSQGSSLIAMAINRSDITCYGVENENRIAEDKIKEIGLANAHFLYGDSCEVSKDFYGRCGQVLIDVLFIDGDHNAPQVYFDVLSWLPHVKRNGYILFHDYESGKFGRRYDVCELKKIFKDYSMFKLRIPCEEENISSSMMIVQKLF